MDSGNEWPFMLRGRRLEIGGGGLLERYTVFH